MLPEPVNPNSRDAAAILTAGVALAKPHDRKHGQPPLFVVPEGYKLEAAPERTFVVQQVTTDSPQAFVDYVKKFKTDSTLVLEDLPDTAVGLVDYHRAVDTPRPNRHKVTLRRELDPAFAAWDEFVNRGTVDQRAFAEFLDEHNADIVKPAGGEVLDLVRKVEAKTTASFSSVIHDSGLQKVVYAEDAEARAGEKGTLEIPREVQIGTPLYLNAGVVTLRIRIRLQVSGGRLHFRLAWLDKDEALRKDADDMAAWLREQLKNTCPVQRGVEGAAD